MIRSRLPVSDALVAECLAPEYRKIASNKDAFEWAAELAEAFLKCKAKHSGLVKVIKENNREPGEQ